MTKPKLGDKDYISKGLEEHMLRSGYTFVGMYRVSDTGNRLKSCSNELPTRLELIAQIRGDNTWTQVTSTAAYDLEGKQLTDRVCIYKRELYKLD